MNLSSAPFFRATGGCFPLPLCFKRSIPHPEKSITNLRSYLFKKYCVVTYNNALKTNRIVARTYAECLKRILCQYYLGNNGHLFPKRFRKLERNLFR